MKMKPGHKKILLWLTMVAAFTAIYLLAPPKDVAEPVTFTRLLDDARRGALTDVWVNLHGDGPSAEFRATDRDNHRLGATGVLTDSVLQILDQENVNLHLRRDDSAPWSSLLASFLPSLLLIILFLLILRRMNTKGNVQVEEYGRAQLTPMNDLKLRFSDVADAPGVVHAKAVLSREVAALANAGDSGAAPLACLLTGPPGCGKTLLLSALAGETPRPMLACNGTSFAHIFVGIGVSRMRDLFKKAREQAPCIVFIDCFDVLARQRIAQQSNERHDEREQTLQQLCLEMDEVINKRQRILIVAATNRLDLVDESVLNGGRFGHQLQLPLPDEAGRRAILKRLVEGKKLDADADLDRLAASTANFSGGALRSLLTDAGRRAAARGSENAITAADLDDALRDAAPRAPSVA